MRKAVVRNRPHPESPFVCGRKGWSRLNQLERRKEMLIEQGKKCDEPMDTASSDSSDADLSEYEQFLDWRSKACDVDSQLKHKT